jgi:hypothetical protein
MSQMALLKATAADIPWHAPGLIDLGPNNGSAITRLAIYADRLLKTNDPIPDSPFAAWAAGRVCGIDKQDLVIFLAGRRGSGKSYSALWIAMRIAMAIARIKGGKWRDYFNLDRNIATLENTQRVMSILNEVGPNSVVIIDDASLAINNRNWASQQNKNFNAILTICRDRRWCLIFTAPLKKMADNQVRDMVDITATVYKPYHADINNRGGFNILKIVSGDIATSGKEYTKKMHFEKKKIDFWVTFRPDLDVVAEYDKLRAEGSKKVCENIIENGSYQSDGKTVQKLSRVEINTKKLMDEHGERITALVLENPTITMSKIAIELGVSPLLASRVVKELGLTLQKKPLKAKGVVEVPDGS